MILISHRGNLYGRTIDRENTTDFIDEALSLGYDVEIDVWLIQESFFLGHDRPESAIVLEWLLNRKNKLWVHCKNKESIEYFNINKIDLNYFWHENDLMTLTSKGYMWVFPGNQPIKNSISVMPELFNDDINECLGLCSDYIIKYMK
jgi:hypothetical protein